MSTIVVTDIEYAKGEAVFAAESDCVAAPAEEHALAQACRNHDAKVAIVGTNEYCGALYEALAGGLIARFGVGTDGIDFEQARAHDVLVVNMPGTLDRSVAEHAVWLMGALARHVAWLHGRTVAGAFHGEMGVELHGRTLGLIGFGGIGRAVARIAGHGLGMRVVAVDRMPLKELAAREKLTQIGWLRMRGLADYAIDADAVLGAADFVSLHLPVTHETRDWLNVERIYRMKAGAYLVNTARGALVDEAALYRGLHEGHLEAAGLDVYAHEPYVPIAPEMDLRTLPNVVMTPHVGSNTVDANARMAAAALENAKAFLRTR